MRYNDRYVSVYYEDDKEIGTLEINKNQTALLIIDMQKIFVDKPASGGERFAEFYEALNDHVVENCKEILEKIRENQMPVCHAKIQCQTFSGIERSLVQKSTGFNELLITPDDASGDIISELIPEKGEIVVLKTTDSALTGTNLRLMLNNMGIRTVIVCGVFTDQCVSSTVRSLADESFDVLLIEDATMAATKRLHETELEILNNIYCHVINKDELLEAL